jgi:hypothetical protein
LSEMAAAESSVTEALLPLDMLVEIHMHLPLTAFFRSLSVSRALSAALVASLPRFLTPFDLGPHARVPFFLASQRPSVSLLKGVLTHRGVNYLRYLVVCVSRDEDAVLDPGLAPLYDRSPFPSFPLFPRPSFVAPSLNF